MKHVIAFDVSMGKSTMVVYEHNHNCQYEGELEHTQTGFRSLRERIDSLTEQDGQMPGIYLACLFFRFRVISRDF